MSLRLQHLFDAVDAIANLDPAQSPDERLLQDLREAWTHLPDDKLMRLIRFIETWAETDHETKDVAFNLLLAWDSYKAATK